jgi:hypothetical protein
MLRANYYGWFQRVERGKYILLPQGEEALKEYRDVLGDWTAGISF